MMELLLSWKHFFLSFIFFLVLYYVSKVLFEHRMKGMHTKRLYKQLTLAGIAVVGFIAVLLAIPMSDVMRSNITNLLGIVISAVLALSSTTFIGNAFAGIFHKLVGTFKPGDMIRAEQYFGKVTEQGLFHTEIQDVSSNLITIPNLYLVHHPVEVFRSSGTLISAELSLGYEIHHLTVEKCLIDAAKAVELEAPFVLVKSLGDFSVVYQINGLLKNINALPVVQSMLRTKMLDVLHDQGIEIVSPAFMNQRRLSDQVFIPNKPKSSEVTQSDETQPNPETIIFDKAEKAESIEKRKEIKIELDHKIEELEKQFKEEKNEEITANLKKRIEALKKGRAQLEKKIDEYIEAFEQED